MPLLLQTSLANSVAKNEVIHFFNLKTWLYRFETFAHSLHT